MFNILPSKSKIERCPAFSPASLLKNPYEGHLKVHPQQNLLKEHLLLIKDRPSAKVAE
ncbi:hypothetical protein A2U01_0088757, partial [Trifolium medium]|nr:hypothetical protein [Trifolium medium]